MSPLHSETVLKCLNTFAADRNDRSWVPGNRELPELRVLSLSYYMKMTTNIMVHTDHESQAERHEYIGFNCYQINKFYLSQCNK